MLGNAEALPSFEGLALQRRIHASLWVQEGRDGLELH